jgi:hypothetical protein
MNCIGIRTIALALLLALTAHGATTQPAIEFSSDSNRIVLVGNGMIEQARLCGFIDYRLLGSSPEHSILCRNLGWSGDSVTGDARILGYQNPPGFERLIKETTELKPTMILVGYGWVESFGGESKLTEFTQNYEKLLDALGKITPKLILISPAGEEGSPPERSSDLEKYTSAISQIAARRRLRFVDLFHPFIEFQKSHPDVRLTSNGLTLNDAGYWLVATEIEKQLGLSTAPVSIQMQADGKILSTTSVDVSDVQASNDSLAFHFRRANLPDPKCPDSISSSKMAVEPATLRVQGLPAGQWTLLIDGRETVHADAHAWEVGCKLPDDLDQSSADELLQEIVKIDDLFYRRERPFNDMHRHYDYIAGDFGLYDKQLAEMDKTIDNLRQPKSHEFKLVRNSKP